LRQPAVKITWTDSSGGARYATYEDPATAAVLEQTSDFPGAGGYGYDLYVSITHTKSVPPDPYARG
jgi:hypothetical protein